MHTQIKHKYIIGPPSPAASSLDLLVESPLPLPLPLRDGRRVLLFTRAGGSIWGWIQRLRRSSSQHEENGIPTSWRSASLHTRNPLDLYIYDYLMTCNLTTTAKAFIKESQARSFCTDVDVIDIPGGLSEWWSIFWEWYVSITDAFTYPEGDALEQKQLEMGHQEEEQIQRRDASLGNSSESDVFSDRMHQGLVANSSQMHSQPSHQFAGIGGMCSPNSEAYPGFFGQGDRTALEHMQELYQQSTKNIALVSSSDQDIMKINFALLGSGMDEGISGISSQARNLEDHHQLYQQNNQQTADALQQYKLLSVIYQTLDQGDMKVVCDNLEGENALDGPIQTSHLQDVESASDMLDLLGDVAVQKTAGIIYEEVIDLKGSSKKIFCCDFSSDGKFLASAGDENKIFTWDFSSNLEKHTWEGVGHCSFISDISFRPNDTLLATASSDKTVRLWDVSQNHPSYGTFVGHSSRVRSVDFHPTDPSFLCSCDDSGKIFFWTIGQPNPHICGLTGRAKVRFHPFGDTIASAIGSTANIIHVEKDKRIRCVQGNNNNKLIHSICWNERGECLATVSDDCVRVWSQRGEQIRELSENLSFFRSCAFHPKYPNTLVIGGYQTITLWNFAENKRVSVQPHNCYVSDLAECRATGLIASSCHDGSVKISRCVIAVGDDLVSCRV